MRDVVVVGASGHAEVVIDILERQGIYRIAGLIDRCVKGHWMGYEILGTESDLPGIVRERDIAGGIVAIGNFDGVHRGHQALLARARDMAKAAGKPWGVITFEPAPGAPSNLAGRLALVVEGGAVDVHDASGGRFGPDPASAYEAWADLVAWAATARGSSSTSCGRCGSAPTGQPI